MNERHFDPQPREPEPAPGFPDPEYDDEVLAMIVGEALLQTVEAIAGRPDDQIRHIAIISAMEQVRRTHRLDVDNTDDRRKLAVLSEHLADALIEIAHHYNELTTSDLQGATGALALRTVQGQLPADVPDENRGDGHE